MQNEYIAKSAEGFVKMIKFVRDKHEKSNTDTIQGRF